MRLFITRPAQGLSLLLMILGLGLSPSRTTTAVGGDCFYECTGPTCYNFGNHADFCQELRAKCQARCSGRKWWGAIAYSPPDKQYGWSNGFDNVSGAQKMAMDKCTKTGSACKLWIWYENECGAIAADGATVTWGTAAIRGSAEQRAIQECKKAGGKNCSIQVWSCSKM